MNHPDLIISNFSLAIIFMGKRGLVALLSLSSWCLVIVVWLFLTVPWVCLQFVIVVFPDHTYYFFMKNSIGLKRAKQVCLAISVVTTPHFFCNFILGCCRYWVPKATHYTILFYQEALWSSLRNFKVQVPEAYQEKAQPDHHNRLRRVLRLTIV